MDFFHRISDTIVMSPAGNVATGKRVAASGFMRAPGPAFTLVELLIVIAIIAILAAMLLPVLRMAQDSARAAQCLSNRKQMALGWVMYAGDNNDWVMPNADESHQTLNSWVDGVLNWTVNNFANINTNELATSMLGGYCSQIVTIYKCPGDILKCQEPQYGFTLADRVRSVSMNGFLEGGIDASNMEAAGLPENENWYCSLSGSQVAYYSYDKLHQINGIHGPGPADMIVFTDESSDTLDDGFFMPVDPSSPVYWLNLPGSYHDKGDEIGFADGHAEYHKWLVGLTCAPLTMPVPLAYATVSCGTLARPSVDYAWVLKHSTAPFP